MNEQSTIVLYLKSLGINFLAVDFDSTLVKVHTGGRWVGEADELASNIRPFFQTLLPIAIQSGINVAIVTFSPQVSLISSVLRLQYPDLASSIVVRGEDGSWEYRGRGNREGKQMHMASAAEEISRAKGIAITRKSTLLIDDDLNNVRHALRNQVRAVHFNTENIELTVNDLMRLRGQD